MHNRMIVTELEQFIRNPPPSFSVLICKDGYHVRSDPEQCVVLIDDFESTGVAVVFQNSLGRRITMRNLWEYTRVRRNLLSKRIYLLMSLCKEEKTFTSTSHSNGRKVLGRYVVSVDGNDPLVRWQMSKGLDRAISSVAGESYRLDVDFSDAVRSWAEQSFKESMGGRTSWMDADFTLKYCSDALFDFPYWFGVSKRKFLMKLS